MQIQVVLPKVIYHLASIPLIFFIIFLICYHVDHSRSEAL